MPKELFLKRLLCYFVSKQYVLYVRISRVGFFEIFFADNNLFVNFLCSLKNFRFFMLNSLVDLVGIDLLYNQYRFHLIYNLLSIRRFYRFFVHLMLLEVPLHDFNTIYKSGTIGFGSLTLTRFKSSGWLERENWDLFGIFFFNNFDLRRLLTDYGFDGFPLRKDFPLTGFLEVRYDDELRSVIYEDLELMQEFRFFDFESPWISLKNN